MQEIILYVCQVKPCLFLSILREDLEYVLREVIRFGDQCKDPQWHNLGQHFSK